MGARWVSAVLLVAACSRPNPYFDLDDRGSTTADTVATTVDTAGTDATTAAMTSTSTTGATSSSSSPTEPTTTTDPTATTDPTTTDPITGTSTVDPTTGTTGEPTEQELCDAAAEDPNAFALVDFHGACGEPSIISWGYTTAINQPLGPTNCGVQNPNVGLILPSDVLLTSEGSSFAPALKLGPWTGSEGLIQGSALALDLAPAKLPCLVARVAYPKGAPLIPLTAQIIIVDASDQEHVVLDKEIPEQGLEAIVLPIPEELRGTKVDVHIITIKQDAPNPSSTALAWERPRIVEGSP